MSALSNLIAYHVESAERVLATFRADLDANPAYAFEWGDGAFKAAATRLVWREIELAATRAGVTIEQIAADVQSRALKAATFPSASTSVSATAMQRFRVAALADAAERLGDVINIQQAKAA